MANKYLEKIAKEQEQSKSHVGKAIGAHIVGGVASMPVGLAAMHAGSKLKSHIHAPGEANLGTVKKFMKDNGLHKTTTFSTNPQVLKKHGIEPTRDMMAGAGGPAYAPPIITGGKKGLVVGVKKQELVSGHRNAYGIKIPTLVEKNKIVNPDIIMHELGHAKDFAKHTKAKTVGLMLSRSPIAHAGFGIGTIAALSNEKTKDYAPAVAAVPGALMLREEGMANYHAYKGIKAHKGATAANKFLRGTVAKNMTNYGLAAAMPVAGAYVAKKIMDHWAFKKKDGK